MFDWFVEFLEDFWAIVEDAFIWLLNGFLWIISELLYLIFDGLLLIVEGFFTLLDLSSVAFASSADWAGLPDQLIWIINQINLPQGFSIILSAISVRVLINLIPAAFTRV
ncbi:MAG: DUF2523 domain-containing protein [Candidatus Electrothrix sp. LOE2]|nr:DUF2523 domain-containing protein [Candidatus Electrothrix sp. LOE2]